VVPLYGGFPFAVASTPGAAVGALAKVVMVYDVRPPFYLMERRGYGPALWCGGGERTAAACLA